MVRRRTRRRIRARAGRAGRRQVELAPAPAETSTNPAMRDPVDVPLSEKVELCLRAEGE